jgi:tetratricopeptide (TPR) repeat protein
MHIVNWVLPGLLQEVARFTNQLTDCIHQLPNADFVKQTGLEENLIERQELIVEQLNHAAENLSQQNRSQRAYQAEILLHESMLETMREIKNIPGQVNALLGLGDAYYEMGRYGDQNSEPTIPDHADAAYRYALKLCQKINTPAHEQKREQARQGLAKTRKRSTAQRQIRCQAEELEQQAENETRKANYEEAVNLYRHALDLKHQLGESDESQIETLRRIGQLLNHLGKYSGAIDIYQEILDFEQALNHQAKAEIWEKIANSYNEMKKHAQTAEARREAVKGSAKAYRKALKYLS